MQAGVKNQTEPNNITALLKTLPWLPGAVGLKSKSLTTRPADSAPLPYTPRPDSGYTPGPSNMFQPRTISGPLHKLFSLPQTPHPWGSSSSSFKSRLERHFFRKSLLRLSQTHSPASNKTLISHPATLSRQLGFSIRV